MRKEKAHEKREKEIYFQKLSLRLVRSSFIYNHFATGSSLSLSPLGNKIEAKLMVSMCIINDDINNIANEPENKSKSTGSQLLNRKRDIYFSIALRISPSWHA